MEEVGGRIVHITLEEALKPTQKQLKIVENIEETLSVKFTGKIKEDARKFIDIHMDAYITTYNLAERGKKPPPSKRSEGWR